MLAESNFPVSFDLLEPRQPVTVRGDAGDHIVQPVAFHVVHQHLRATGPESKGMFFPNRIVGQRRGLFPPAVLLKEVNASVAVDVAVAQSVRKPLPFAFGRDGMELPRRPWVLPVRLCIPTVAARATNHLRFAVPGHICKAGRLVIKFTEDDMALPMSVAAFGVFIPSRLLAWEPIDQNIHPAIAVEVIDKTEEVVRVHIVGPKSAFEARYGFFDAVGFLASKSGIGGIKLVAFLELGAFIPVGTANNVHLSVAVEIAKVGALSPKLTVKLALLKNVEGVICSG